MQMLASPSSRCSITREPHRSPGSILVPHDLRLSLIVPNARERFAPIGKQPRKGAHAPRGAALAVGVFREGRLEAEVGLCRFG